MDKKPVEKVKMKLKKGDKVKVIAGSEKGKEGKILAVDRAKGKVVVEGVNMVTKHVKPGKSRDNQQGGLIHKEGYIQASNVMYIHNGKPTRLGIKITKTEKGGSVNIVKSRVAKSTGDVIND